MSIYNKEIVIKSSEIIDYIDCYSANIIGDIYNIINEETRFNSLPILDNPCPTSYHDFIKLIIECLNSNEIFKENNKLD